ncbi:kinesin-like protein KIN-12C [Dioscorea cayenensis subsp. rotundata]|uniref:Kinesin-like protein KIN-12C n=1 Tax=Dioscorea cayennensis subsp. rotundata TaxID=55577 RepID=A0AB40CJU4_DIOCR|nr:kinesin-like protein KIN-12C [Dioscorea cayenensis subsp. rotundata]
MEPLQTVSSPISPLRPKSFTDARSRTSPIPQISISGRENIPPTHPNVPIDQRTSPSSRKKIPSIEAPIMRENPRSDAPGVGSPDSSVKVVVRIRPVSGHGKTEDHIVKKISSDSLSVGDRKFTFTSVLGPESSQEDVFKLIGVPLVQSALAGYNASIVSYGQTGTGKTFTMWGPQSAMVDAHSISSYQGIVPRIFQMLFAEISKKQKCLEENNISYQCRCSFLEIYNEQIIDLLNPSQRNLQIHDDAKSGFYVENLTDEYVNNIDDATQILITGLSNRKVGATSVHSKSSRSHIIFTCTLESWCKGTQSKNFSSSKISKISLVDLAGLDKHKPEGVGERTEDGRDVKQSLAKLGKLINILSGVARTGEDQKIPYMDSPLTHLLKDTLGGNAKVTYLCSISPDNRDKAGTLSTLRFGELVKEIQNKAVINEISDDDFSGLSDQIRQLKEELIREKSSWGNSLRTNRGHFKAQNARESLNQLRVSLNRSLILPRIDNIDSEEEIDVDMEDVRELCDQLQNAHSSSEDDSAVIVETVDGSTAEEILVTKTDLEHDAGIFVGEDKFEELDCETSVSDLPDGNAKGGLRTPAGDDHVQKSSEKYMLSIIPGKQFRILHDPTLSESPKIDKNLKNGVVNSFDISEGSTKSLRNFESNSLRASLRSSKVSPTESLAASLHRGLQIIDYHQQNSASRKPFLGLSFEQFVSKSHQTENMSDASVQTSLEDGGTAAAFLCLYCRKMNVYSGNLQHENLDMKIVPVKEAGLPEISVKQMLQDKLNVLADVSTREMELEALCAEQADKIKQLKCLVDWCKDRHEQCSNLNENQDVKILCLEGPADDGAVYRKKEHVPSDELVLMNRHLKNETEVSMGKYCSSKTSFDFGAREDLIKEIQTLKDQLKSYANTCRDDAKDYRDDSSLLEQIRKGTAAEKTEDELERERQRWTESESRWICLTEELRVDLELYRQRAEKTELELSMEKRCSAELDDALHRAILGHSRIVEEYVELQENHGIVLERYKKVMEGIAEVKKAAKKAGAKGTGSAFTEALAAELSTLRVERERERTRLKAENKGLKIQLRDTAEAVHAAGELLVRLREAEEAVTATEEKYERAQQDNEKMRKQVEKLKRKHAMEMVTMKHYLAESRLPESALEPFYQHDSESLGQTEDDHSWRAAFRPSYQ